VHALDALMAYHAKCLDFFDITSPSRDASLLDVTEAQLDNEYEIHLWWPGPDPVVTKATAPTFALAVSRAIALHADGAHQGLLDPWMP
jgi:hypothetical protein